MNVHSIELKSTFDIVLCLQNGISSMGMTPEDIKNIIKLQKIAIKSNNHKLYSSVSSYKKKLLTKNLIITQSTS